MLKYFKLGLIARVVLIIAISNCLSYTIWQTNWLIIPAITIILLVITAIELYTFVSKTNRDLSKFFFALRHNDFNLKLSQPFQGANSAGVYNELLEILKIFSEIKLDKESDYLLIKSILNEMPSGVLLVNLRGDIVLANRAFLNFVQAPKCSSISQLENQIHGISKTLKEIEHGRKSFSVKIDGDTHQLLASHSSLKFRENLNLYVVHGVADTFENHELDAWNKLIRILTHEIMNSITSISSLSSTGLEILNDNEENENLKKAMTAIKRRSEGLLEFVERYRRFTNIAAPQKTWLRISNEVSGILQLMEEETKRINVEVSGDNDLSVYADSVQFQQALQNILLNAVYAVKNEENPSIKISWSSSGRTKKVFIRDNGIGLSPEQLNDVFIPFYTTRESGSGIGLSLVRQIMQKHGGGVSIASSKGEYTELTLRFLDY